MALGKSAIGNQQSAIPSLLLPIAKCDLHHRNGVGIVLLFALKTKQVVIRAALRKGKLTTNCRSRIVDRAAAGFRMEELTRLAKKHILLPPQHPFLLENFRVARGRNLFGDAEVSREPANVARRDLHAFVDRAAVGRTVTTIVIRPRLTRRSGISHDRELSPQATGVLIFCIQLATGS